MRFIFGLWFLLLPVAYRVVD